MKVKFFLFRNEEFNVPPSFNTSKQINELRDNEVKQRTLMQLEIQLELLTKMVDTASKSLAKEDMPVIICGEDFFQGGDIFKGPIGQCFDRDTTYCFIRDKLTNLSKKYPNVLIVPGSMYVTEKGKMGLYDQNSTKGVKGNLYTQNIVPIFYNGSLIRIIKKGGFLQYEDQYKKRHDVCDSATHKHLIEKNIKMSVVGYHEDQLDDYKHLIFVGKTPLPGERECLERLKIYHDDIYSPIFLIKELKFGLEICGDSHVNTLSKQNLDFHIVVSNGIISSNIDSCKEDGFFVQADAGKSNYFSHLSFTSPDGKTLDVKLQEKVLPGALSGNSFDDIQNGVRCDVKEMIEPYTNTENLTKLDTKSTSKLPGFKYLECPEISELKCRNQLDGLLSLIADCIDQFPFVKSGLFAGSKPRYYRDLQLIVDKLKVGVHDLDINEIKVKLKDIIEISHNLGKQNPILKSASKLLNLLNPTSREISSNSLHYN